MSGVTVHPSAFVDEPSDIGDGTVVWHFCHVMAHARIGRGCTLGQNVHVASGVTIAPGVRTTQTIQVLPTFRDHTILGPRINPEGSNSAMGKNRHHDPADCDPGARREDLNKLSGRNRHPRCPPPSQPAAVAFQSRGYLPAEQSRNIRPHAVTRPASAASISAIYTQFHPLLQCISEICP
jgi:hypothetical protein